VHAVPGEALKSAQGRRNLDFAYLSLALRF
jgi:hypothetical protein